MSYFRQTRAFCWVLALPSLLLPFCFPSYGQQSEFFRLASKLAERTGKLSSKENPKRILVVDFPRCNGPYTELGKAWADELSLAIAAAPQVEAVDRAGVRRILGEEKLEWSELENESVARWIGRTQGAHGVVTGCLAPEKERFNLRVSLLDVAKDKGIAKETIHLPNSRAEKELLARNLAPLNPPLETRPDRLPSGERILQGGRDGLGYPTCKSCPGPEFTEQARRAKIQGAVLLEAVITTDGRVMDIRVIRGLPLGLSKKAVQAVQKWRLNPARGPDGQPVAVWQRIEVNFRIFE